MCPRASMSLTISGCFSAFSPTTKNVAFTCPRVERVEHPGRRRRIGDRHRRSARRRARASDRAPPRRRTSASAARRSRRTSAPHTPPPAASDAESGGGSCTTETIASTTAARLAAKNSARAGAIVSDGRDDSEPLRRLLLRPRPPSPWRRPSPFAFDGTGLLVAHLRDPLAAGLVSPRCCRPRRSSRGARRPPAATPAGRRTDDPRASAERLQVHGGR